MKKIILTVFVAVLVCGFVGCSKGYSDESSEKRIEQDVDTEENSSEESVSGQNEDNSSLETGKVIEPVEDYMKEYIKDGIPNGVYHVTASGAKDYSSDDNGQYMNLEFWSYDTFDINTIMQMKEGDKIVLRGEEYEIHTLEQYFNQNGDTTGFDINGGVAEGEIYLMFDYDENCFRESEDSSSYVLYSVGTRKVRLSDDFLYDDHSSAEYPGAEEPEGARGDASTFFEFIKDRELYGNNSYAEIKNGELTALTIEWAP